MPFHAHSLFSKSFVTFTASLILLLAASRSAYATENEPSSASSASAPSTTSDAHAPSLMHHHKSEPMEVRAFGETGIAVRTLELSGLTLRNAGVSSTDADKGSMLVRGSDVSPAVLTMLGLGGGVAVGPFLAGGEIGVGMGGGAHARTSAARDIDVRPSGFAAAMTASTFLGVMLETKHARYRLDGVLGWELAGLGMERPGFPDTSVSAVNGERWTLGPRLRADFIVVDGVSVGAFLGWDARHPMNTSLGLVMSLL